MSDAYTGEIRMWPCRKCPVGWNFCDGTVLDISQYQPLFSLIGTTYGGDGKTKFALPDLRNKVPLHYGNGPNLTPRALGAKGGTATATLTVAQLPAHTHGFLAAISAGNSSQIASAASMLAAAGSSGMDYYQTAGHGETVTELNALTIQDGGSGAAHANIMPTQTLNFIIALNGLYPIQG